MRLFFLLGILFFLISCGKKNDGNDEGAFNKNSGNPTTREIYTETDPDKRLSEVIDWYHVSCEKPMECPGYMAMLVLEEKVDFGFSQYRCSSFLIGDDVLATNAHCIPDDLKEGDSCVDRIFALFPKSKVMEGQRIGCEKILSKFRDDDLGYDYAFIKLSKKTGREVPEVDHGERFNGMDATFWKVDPREGYFGLVRKSTCKLVDDSLLSYSRFFSPFSPSIGFAGCESIRGNSGSPLLNSEGKVIGINRAAFSDYTPEDEFYKDLIPDGHFEFLHFGTNFGCLCKRGEVYTNECENTSESCRKKTNDQDKEEKFDQFMRERAKKLFSNEDKQLLQDLMGHFNGYPVELGWRFSEKSEFDGPNYKSFKIYAGMVPKCIKDRKDFLAQSNKDGIWTNSEDLALRIPGTSLCEIEATFNSKLQITGIKINPDKCVALDSWIQFWYTNPEERTIDIPVLNVGWGYDTREGHNYVFSRYLGLEVCPKNSLGSASTLDRHPSFE